ncbi:hypothetical protein SH449x_002831 [Pirellulaceae bacterium SH449]
MIVSGQWFGDGRRSSITAFKALFGFGVFGYTGFMYAAFGRFTWMAETEECDCGDDCPVKAGVDYDSEDL